MEQFGMGAGLAALGFWLFVAIMIAAGVWGTARKRESEHETLRRIVESGRPLDDEMTDRLLGVTGGAENKNLGRDLKVGGYIMLGLAPGLVAMGWIMGMALAEELFMILLGVAALVVCLAVGLLVAARFVNQWTEKENAYDRFS